MGQSSEICTLGTMSFSMPSKMFQFGCTSSRKISTTPSSKTVFGSAGATPDRMRDHQGIDRETVDIMYTSKWDRGDKMGTVKDDIKMLVREEMSRVKQEQMNGKY